MGIEVVAVGIPGPYGLAVGTPGKSAYQLAVEEGFDGTIEEWLDSLNGLPGAPGPSIPYVFHTVSSSEYILDAELVTVAGQNIIELTNAGDVAVTLPTPVSIGKSSGSVSFQMVGTGIPTISNGGGIAVIEGNGVFTKQWEIKTAIIRDETTWRIIGAQ